MQGRILPCGCLASIYGLHDAGHSVVGTLPHLTSPEQQPMTLYLQDMPSDGRESVESILSRLSGRVPNLRFEVAASIALGRGAKQSSQGSERVLAPLPRELLPAARRAPATRR